MHIRYANGPDAVEESATIRRTNWRLIRAASGPNHSGKVSPSGVIHRLLGRAGPKARQHPENNSGRAIRAFQRPEPALARIPGASRSATLEPTPTSWAGRYRASTVAPRRSSEGGPCDPGVETPGNRHAVAPRRGLSRPKPGTGIGRVTCFPNRSLTWWYWVVDRRAFKVAPSTRGCTGTELQARTRFLGSRSVLGPWSLSAVWSFFGAWSLEFGA